MAQTSRSHGEVTPITAASTLSRLLGQAGALLVEAGALLAEEVRVEHEHEHDRTASPALATVRAVERAAADAAGGGGVGGSSRPGGAGGSVPGSPPPAQDFSPKTGRSAEELARNGLASEPFPVVGEEEARLLESLAVEADPVTGKRVPSPWDRALS